MRNTQALLFTLFMAGSVSSTIAAPLTVKVSSERLTIEGVTPGSAVTLMGMVQESGYYMIRFVPHRELLTDADRDGRIEYAPRGGIAFRSIWVVTDLQTGETNVAAQAGFKTLVMRQRGAGQGSAVSVTPALLDVGRKDVDVLVVRPGRGAWTLPIRGRGTEPPTAPGRVRVSVSKLQPLRGDFGAAPAALIPGDVVVILDLERLEYWTTKFTEGGQ